MPLPLISRKIRIIVLIVFACAILFSLFLAKGIKEFNYFKQLSYVRDLSAHLIDQKKEILRLNAALNNVSFILEENKRLENMLGLKNKNQAQLLPCRVTARTPFDWERKIKIDRGEGEGLIRGSIVLDSFGRLAGSIEKVDKKSSWVILVSDPDFRISVLCSDELYLLAGFSSVYSRLLYVPYDAPLKHGDEIFIVRPSFPFPNIPIGRIDNVTRNSDLLTLSVDVKLYSDVENLTLVFTVPGNTEK